MPNYSIPLSDGLSVYREYSDEKLMDLLRRKDQKAFTEIYNRYWTLMYSHVYKMLRDDEETKDTVQELFSNIWLKAEQIKTNQNLGGFLFCSARNMVFNFIEKKNVRQHYIQSILSFVNSVESNSVEQIDEKRLRNVIESEIQNLPPKMRRIFELSRQEELSHQEIAQKLDISYQTVKKQVQNALKIIKPKIDHLVFWLSFCLFF